jgi:hypothetical protein
MAIRRRMAIPSESAAADEPRGLLPGFCDPARVGLPKQIGGFAFHRPKRQSPAARAQFDTDQHPR